MRFRVGVGRDRSVRRVRMAGVLVAATSAFAVGSAGSAVVLVDQWGTVASSPRVPSTGVPGERIGAAPQQRAQPPLLPVFASADGVHLRSVSPQTVAVAYHEASFPDAVALHPRGQCRVCRNPTKYNAPPAPSGDGSYIVMDSRGREQAATSAADVVVPVGASVLAPVTGVVTGVKRYRLYWQYQDVRLELRPRGRSNRRVVVLHLKGCRLVRGDHVEASVTPLGRARRFPFESQLDRYVRGRLPHVHVEVKDPAARPRTGPAHQKARGNRPGR